MCKIYSCFKRGKLPFVSKFATAFLFSFMFLLSATSVIGQTVTTDQPDYAPRSNAIFTGSGFRPGETVQLKVKNLFRPCNTVMSDSSYLPWTVQADDAGGFVTNWTVCDCLGDSLRLKATGQVSGLIAYAYFSDGNSKLSVTDVTGFPGQTVSVSARLQQQGGTGIYGNNNGIPNKTITFTINGTVVGTAITSGTGTDGNGGILGTATLSIVIPDLPSGQYNNAVEANFATEVGATSQTQDKFTGSSAKGKLAISSPCVAPSITLVPTNVSCNGAANGSINLTTTGGNFGPLTYLWSNNSTSEDISGLAPGDYSITVTNATGSCSLTSSAVTITQPAAISVTNATVTSAILCNGSTGTVTIVATGGTTPLSYTFNNETNTTGIFNGVHAGDNQGYSVTDANSCGPVTGTVNVTEPAAIGVTSASVTTAILCNGGTGTVTIAATGGTTPLSYTFNNETNTTGEFMEIYAGDNQGYSVTDANGCEPVTGTVNVAEPAAMSVTSAAVTSAILCNGGTGTVTIAATGGTKPLSYTFNNETNTTGIFTGVYAGDYQGYSVTDANGCGPVTGTINVTQPDAINVGNASVTSEILCNGGTGTVTIVADGGTTPLSYTFNNETNTTGIFTGVLAGNNQGYSVTDANGCGPVTGTVNVIEPTLLTASLISNKAILYYGYSGDQTATITGCASGGVGPYKIRIEMNRPLHCNVANSSGDELWTNGSGTVVNLGGLTCPSSGSSSSNAFVCASSSSSFSINVTLMANATFSITVTDANGCTATNTVTLNAEDVRCFAGKSGNAKISLCHRTGNSKNPCVEICVDENAVDEHLAHGDYMGKCLPNCAYPAVTAQAGSALMHEEKIRAEKLVAKVLPNPAPTEFRLLLESNSDEEVKIVVTDMYGKVLHTANGSIDDMYRFGTKFPSGMYLVTVIQGSQIKTIKVIKSKG